MLKNSFSFFAVEAGCDEAGRGCLAGPVFAAAVILPANFSEPLLNDSKKISLKTRQYLRQIVEKNAIDFAVAKVDVSEIDKINILNASILAMNKALLMLKTKPEFIIIDGNRFKTELKIPFQCIVKGDGLYMSIAAASILAKTYRDDFMEKIHYDYPHYQWLNNKGYPTKDHCKAILKNGLSPWHRRSFHFKGQLSLNFIN